MAVQYVHACGEDVEVTKSFTYLRIVVHNSSGSYLEVAQQNGLPQGFTDSV